MENRHTLDDLKFLQSMSLEMKIQKSIAKIIEWYERHDGKVYVSFSGGKDSTVLLHLVRSFYPDVPAVFVNTGLEYPEVVEHAKKHPDALKRDNIDLGKLFWECAVGQGHLAEVLKKHGHVSCSDIVDRGYPGTFICDFLTHDNEYYGTIITNPPFKLAHRFVEKGMQVLREGGKLCLFLKIQFLESVARKQLFKQYPPKYIYVNSERQHTAKDGNFGKYNMSIGTLCYCWFVWEKGFTGDPIVRWI